MEGRLDLGLVTVGAEFFDDAVANDGVLRRARDMRPSFFEKARQRGEGALLFEAGAGGRRRRDKLSLPGDEKDRGESGHEGQGSMRFVMRALSFSA